MRENIYSHFTITKWLITITEEYVYFFINFLSATWDAEDSRNNSAELLQSARDFRLLKILIDEDLLPAKWQQAAVVSIVKLR